MKEEREEKERIETERRKEEGNKGKREESHPKIQVFIFFARNIWELTLFVCLLIKIYIHINLISSLFIIKKWEKGKKIPIFSVTSFKYRLNLHE